MSDLVIVAVGMSASMPLLWVAVWFALHVDRKLKQRACLFAAAGAAVQTVMCMLLDNLPMACLDAAGVAWFLYLWWNTGGGDGLKRRLKSLSGYLGFGRSAAPEAA